MYTYIVTYRCPRPNCDEEVVLPLDAPSEHAVLSAPGPHCPRHKGQTTKPIDVRENWYLAA